MSEDRIASIMQTDVIRLRAETPIREAISTLISANVSAAPVVDDSGALIGILSQKDCFKSALNASYYQQWSGTVGDHLTTNVETLNAETDFVTAADAFLSKPYRIYPVLREGQLVGVLGRSDLLAAFLRQG